MRKPSGSIMSLTCVLIFAANANIAQQTSSSPISTTAAQLLEPSRPLDRELRAGEKHAYEITLESGQFLDAAVNQRGIDVTVLVFAPDGSKIAEIDSPNGKQGDEPIRLQVKTAGRYRIEIIPNKQGGETAAGRYQIRINEILSAADYATRLAERRQKQQAVIAWLKENAIPIKTVEAGSGFQDLQPLKHIFKDVRFVGLGEETHGTREFFQFKHRMVEFLVKEMAFRVFAIEASYSACENINDYVMGKVDDGAKALESQGFWTWNTEEVRAMLDWMRAYNAGVPAEKRVKFVGLDVQVNDRSTAALLEYLKRVAPERVAETEAFFKVPVEGLAYEVHFEKGDRAKEALEKLKELRNQYNDLFIFLELHSAELLAKSNQAECDQMREYARVLAQYMDAYSHAGSISATRDLFMADNLRRIAARQPANTRFIIWAHNGHVMTDNSKLGYHLRRFYGGEYYALGFSFNQGSFQAVEAQPKDPQRVMPMSFTVNPAPVESIDWYLAQTGEKIILVDLRSAANKTTVSEWTAVAHPMRAIGATYDTRNENKLNPTVLKQSFDGLFFIDTTTRARPNH
jgi:erythromycin esterase